MAMLENPDPADWLHMSRTYDQQRHSPLDQVNKSNVGQLQMVWSRGLPIGAQESSPIVYDGVMYVIAPGWRWRPGARRHQRRSNLGTLGRAHPSRDCTQQESRHLPGYDLSQCV